MRQLRIVCKGSPPTPWLDISNPDIISYAHQCVLRWRKKGWTSEEIKFEYRNKPNIFIRIKEWWNNE
jgi:hypothetical protein